MAYFPNGSAGEYLESQCAICPLGQEGIGCPVKLVQLIYNYDQCDKGQEKLKAAMNLLINEDGDCQVRPFLEPPKGIRSPGDPPAFLTEASR